MKRFAHAGEKIRYLRNTIGITQEELASDQISKSLISMIEKNRRNITWHTATIIADSLNKYYNALNKNITAEFLMETEVDVVKRNFRKDIEKLNKAIKFGHVDDTIIQNNIEKIKNSLIEWNLVGELAELQMLEGDYFYSTKQYTKALKIYLDTLDYFIEEHNYSFLVITYIKIGCLFLEEYNNETAIVYFLKASQIAENKELPNKALIKVKCTYHQMHCYYTIKAYDHVFLSIEELKHIDWEEEEFRPYYYQTQLIEANTLRNIKNFQKAKYLYDKIYEEKEKLDKETLFFLYEGYAILDLNLKKINRALVFSKKALTLKSSVNSNYLAPLYITQAKCYYQLGMYDKAFVQLEYGFTLAEWVSNFHMMVEIHFAYFNLYSKIKEFNKAEDHLIKAEGLIIAENLNVKKVELYSYYIELHSLQEAWEKVSIYTDKLRL